MAAINISQGKISTIAMVVTGYFKIHASPWLPDCIRRAAQYDDSVGYIFGKYPAVAHLAYRLVRMYRFARTARNSIQFKKVWLINLCERRGSLRSCVSFSRRIIADTLLGCLSKT